MHIAKWFDEHFEEYAIVALTAIMVLFICMQVFTRYILEISLAWSEELSRYMFIWSIYLGISYGIKKNRHICVDVVMNMFSVKAGRYFALIADFLFLFFAAYILNKGTELVQRIVLSGQTSPACELPMWIVYGALPFGMALACFRILQGIWIKITEIRKEARGDNQAAV